MVTGKIPFIDLKAYNKKINPNTEAEYYYVFASDYDTLKDNFELVYKFAPDRWLLKKRAEISE